MTPETKTTVVLGSVFLTLLIVAALTGGIFIGKGCGGSPTAPELGIDAGPGLTKIDARERELREETAMELQRIEAERRESLEALDTQERDEYERIRKQGPDAVVEWLNAFDTARFRR